MTEETLLRLCSEDDLETFYGVVFDWTSEYYGSGRHLRKYGFYPEKLRLYVHTSHGGPGIGDTLAKSDREFNAPTALFYNPRYVRELKKISNKECHTIIAPNVFYRRSHKISQAPDASGTLAFYSHSTSHIDNVANVQDYIDDLNNLDKRFHPISVMLHFADVNKGTHKPFMDAGFSVYTAGNWRDYRFTERFYNILKKFKYSTSNAPMSCLFYSIEMGIPHFLYGSKPKYFNKGDWNLPIGEYDYEQKKIVKKIRGLFDGISTEITPQQREFVEDELGVYHTISRLKCSYILYKAIVTVKINTLIKRATGSK